MRELHSQGYRTQSFETWKHARDYGTPIAGRALHIVFDEPSNALISIAQPVLARLGFTATCILTVDPLRGSLILPTGNGQSGLLKWRELRGLQAAGMKFGVRIHDDMWCHERSMLDLARLITQARAIASGEVAEAISLLRVPGSLIWNQIGRAHV